MHCMWEICREITLVGSLTQFIDTQDTKDIVFSVARCRYALLTTESNLI